MDIKEKAKQYAEGKALEAITSAIEQAYADGYEDGMKHRENEELELIKDGVKYVDLGLPSGTLWSSSCIRDISKTRRVYTYIEASKFSIPTKDQFLELCKECVASPFYNSWNSDQLRRGIKFIGPTGESIIVEYISISEFHNVDKPETVGFWLRDNEDNNYKKYAEVKVEEGKAKPIISNLFMGLKSQIMLVKKHEDLA